MIRRPAGFRARIDGDALIFEAPGDDLVVRYVERRHPVTPIEELWGAEVPSVGPAELLVTDEGEYAWIMEGERDDHRGHLTRFLGAVVGDDYLAVLEATTARRGRHAEIGDLVEHLLRTDTHMLGKRRRPYRHAAPADWSVEIRAPFYTYYRPRAGAATIYVAPAIPRSVLDRESMLVSLGVDCAKTTPIHARLSGTWSSTVRSDGRHLDAFVLDDMSYFYAAVADAAPNAIAAARDALRDIAASVEGLPDPTADRCRAATASWMID